MDDSHLAWRFVIFPTFSPERKDFTLSWETGHSEGVTGRI